MSLNLILADAAPKTTAIGPGAPQAAGPAAAPQLVTTTIVAEAGAPGAVKEQPQMPFYANPMFMILLMIAVLFFFTFRSNKKQQQKRQRMLDAIVKGTRVLLNTGVYGTIVEVKDKTYMIEIADKVVVEAVKAGVAEVIGQDAAPEKK